MRSLYDLAAAEWRSASPIRARIAAVSLAATAALAVSMYAHTVAAATADPFAPAVSAGNAATNFLIWVVRILGFGGLAFAAMRGYFKKFDFVLLGSVLGGLLLVAGAPAIINYLFSLGGLSDAGSIATYGGVK